MADQGKWFKLWCSALDDNDLENLSIHEWFCWARLGAYIKKHGKEGKIVFSSPARALMNLFRVADFPTALDIIKRFPSCKLGERSFTVTGETSSTVTVDVEYLNWLKYQGDFSNDRVRKFRDKKRHGVTAQEEKRRRRDVEEKRRDTTTPIIPQGGEGKVLEWFEKTWTAYPKERRVFKKACLRSYQKDVKTLEEAKSVARALETYLKTETVKNGFIKNASTFFANWRDYAADDRGNSQGLYYTPPNGQPAGLHQEHGEGSQAANDAITRLADSKTF